VLLNDAEPGGNSESLRQQTILARFGELALKSNDLDQILTEACRLIGEALGTDLAKVMEIQPDGETLLVRSGVGWKPGVVGRVTVRITEDSSEAHALKTDEPMISPDIAEETRFQYPSFLTDHGVKAVANVVIIGGKGKPPFGILQIDSRAPRAFDDDDTAFLRSYANLVAAAVERLRSMREERAGQERLRLALDAGALGNWELDLATGEVNRSRRHDEIFGYAQPVPDWTMEMFQEQVVPEDLERVISTFHGAVATRTEWHCECRIRRKDDGALRWVEVWGLPVGGEPNVQPKTMLGIIADITGRKSTEEALRRSNDLLEARVAERTHELSEANAKLLSEATEREQVEEALRQSHKMEAIGQLTGGIAHDFNNMLQVIGGSLELMSRRVEQGRPAEAAFLVNSARTTVERAAALTHRLLAFARRQTLQPRPVEPDNLIRSLVELIQRTVGPGVAVEVRSRNGVWTVLCDPNQLENVLLNLAINARDAMPEGGTLTISTRDVRLSAAEAMRQKGVRPGDYVEIAISDTGAGMDEATRLRAFEPFFTTKPLGQGTGLGLSQLYGFAKQSGGAVQLDSAPGRGTTVLLYLPRHALVQTDDMLPAPSAQPESAAGGTAVLLVEDEAQVRHVAAETLRDLGYQVLEAPNGPAALDILQDTRLRIDALVTDVGLPGGMNGRQVADAARQARPSLPVLFITGYAGTVLQDQLAPGMEVIGKPFTLQTLAAKISSMLAEPAHTRLT
jgi:PAS domain S-box-containing protein